jgi:hypothetical protein
MKIGSVGPPIRVVIGEPRLGDAVVRPAPEAPTWRSPTREKMFGPDHPDTAARVWRWSVFLPASSRTPVISSSTPTPDRRPELGALEYGSPPASSTVATLSLAELALQHAELVTLRQHLGTELGVGLS